jgi:anaerobic magnesium-protoporphyrin IX monomethyl ester cyclase
MKILLCNIAIRSKPDPFPPVASTTLMNMLKKNGYESSFYDIDALRPSCDELTAFFRDGQFDIVGISAVVSTGYEYTKNLAACINKVSPQTSIILGGNLAGAYEIVLRKCPIDICVIGEGERVLLNLVKHWEIYRDFVPNDALHRIKGLTFLEKDKKVCFTGTEKLIDACDIEEPDYALIEKYSNIAQYIFDPLSRSDFSCDPRATEPKRQNKKAATLFTSKGCVNNCSFCHRWVKGYRVLPVEKIIEYIKRLIHEYNIGFFTISDECFGEDEKWLNEFIRLIKPLDVLFQVGGARVSMLGHDPLIMERLKEAGLTAIYFGIESGSDKILRIMNKNATKSDNLEALKYCQAAGVYTVIQLVIGMPGENDDTIAETIEFIKDATGQLPYPPLVTVNYLQALPGTPSYEFLKLKELIKKTTDDEERYLLHVSDVDASELKQYINVSESPLPEVMLWKLKIRLLPVIHWLKIHHWKLSQDPGSKNAIHHKSPITASLKRAIKNSSILYRAVDLSGDVFWKIALIKNRFSVLGFGKTVLFIFGFIKNETRDPFKLKAEPLHLSLKLNNMAM